MTIFLINNFKKNLDAVSNSHQTALYKILAPPCIACNKIGSISPEKIIRERKMLSSLSEFHRINGRVCHTTSLFLYVL